MQFKLLLECITVFLKSSKNCNRSYYLRAGIGPALAEMRTIQFMCKYNSKNRKIQSSEIILPSQYFLARTRDNHIFPNPPSFPQIFGDGLQQNSCDKLRVPIIPGVTSVNALVDHFKTQTSNLNRVQNSLNTKALFLSAPHSRALGTNLKKYRGRRKSLSPLVSSSEGYRANVLRNLNNLKIVKKLKSFQEMWEHFSTAAAVFREKDLGLYVDWCVTWKDGATQRGRKALKAIRNFLNGETI